MTILVTGSAGHLGEGIMRTLRTQGRACRGVDIKPSQWTDLVGSISDAAFCSKVMEGVNAVIHTATLHKPHVVTHSRQDFIDTNVTGTQNLLETAVSVQAEAFVFISTTSAFGDSLRPAPGTPAVWIDESVPSTPKNIYGATKTAAEDLCQLMHRLKGLPVITLRVSRFFPEADDSKAVRGFCSSDNAKANELLFRRADISDMVSAALAAVGRAPALGYGKYIIASDSPFQPHDLADLRTKAPSVVANYFSNFDGIYAEKGWKMFSSIDRVYDNKAAKVALNWQPQFTFSELLDQGHQYSDLHRAIGEKGYHGQVFSDGPYPVDHT